MPYLYLLNNSTRRTMNMTPLIATHMSAAIGAVCIGPLAIWARKGQTQRPALHRYMGYTWVVLMLITAFTALFIRDFRLPNINGFTAIHLLIPATFGSLMAAFYFLRQGNIKQHRRFMVSLYINACIVAGVFTLYPGRYLGNWVWGTQGDTSTAAKPMLLLVSGILNRTPMWVWGLLLGLIALGLMQARTRELTYKRVLIIPIVMLVLSLLGAVSTAGGSFTTVVLWLLGYASVAFALSRPALPNSSYNPSTQRFIVTGSYWPLVVMLAIFVTKFAVGIATATGAAWMRSAAFPIVIALLYGGFSGFFAGRALRLLKLKYKQQSESETT
jgi:uncharacterized membrane protein